MCQFAPYGATCAIAARVLRHLAHAAPDSLREIRIRDASELFSDWRAGCNLDSVLHEGGGLIVDYQFVVATSDADREAAFRLRYAVFVKEVGAFEGTKGEREADEFDAHSTHFLAKLGDEVVGTVRVHEKRPELARARGLLFGLPSEDFYDYAPFERDGIGLSEVSRSSVLAEHRGTKVVANLWKIAYNYSRARGLTHIISMAHIGYTDSLLDAGIVFDMLESGGLLHPRYHLTRREIQVHGRVSSRPLYSDSERQTPRSLKPPLATRLFHRFGLRACGRPVFVPTIGRVGMAMLACPETFSANTLEFFHAPDPAHHLD